MTGVCWIHLQEPVISQHRKKVQGTPHVSTWSSLYFLLRFCRMLSMAYPKGCAENPEACRGFEHSEHSLAVLGQWRVHVAGGEALLQLQRVPDGSTSTAIGVNRIPVRNPTCVLNCRPLQTFKNPKSAPAFTKAQVATPCTNLGFFTFPSFCACVSTGCPIQNQAPTLRSEVRSTPAQHEAVLRPRPHHDSGHTSTQNHLPGRFDRPRNNSTCTTDRHGN